MKEDAIYDPERAAKADAIVREHKRLALCAALDRVGIDPRWDQWRDSQGLGEAVREAIKPCES